MALNDVNSNPTLLPGYQLKLHWNDSGVSARETESAGREQMNSEWGPSGRLHIALSCFLSPL